ncbi:MAG: hypothetical protein WBL33_10620 [Candidatus Acidiferrales bacterium]
MPPGSGNPPAHAGSSAYRTGIALAFVGAGFTLPARLAESCCVSTRPSRRRPRRFTSARVGTPTLLFLPSILILARYQMNVQVYYHKIRRIYDHYLEEYSKIWGAINYKEIGDVLKHDDTSVMADIRRDAGADGPAQTWARRIVERRHHRVVHETGDSADLAALKRAKRFLKQLQEDFPKTDFYLDDSNVPIYKLWVTGQQEEPQTQNLYINERNGSPRLLTEDSIIIGKIPDRVRTVRIFADAEDTVLTGIRKRAKELEGNV